MREGQKTGGRKKRGGGEDAPVHLEKTPQSDAERIALLEEAVDRQLAYILTHPAPDLAARVRDVKAAMDMLAALRGKDAEHETITVSFME